MKKAINLKNIYSKQYLLLICIGFLPLCWKVLEIVLLSGFVNGLKILAQISLIQIIFKIFEETLLNPLYKLLGKDNYKTEEDKNTIAKKFLIYYSIATLAFTALVFILLSPILSISQIPEEIFNQTKSFLNIYIISCGLGVISKYLHTFSIINKDTKKMFIYLLLKALATAVLFVIFVPQFSMKLGVIGIAISELVVNILTIVYLFLTFPKTQSKHTIFDKKLYFRLAFFSFAETLIRNIVYYFIILVFLNMINNQDLYFVSNDFIWAIMLVPTLAQSTLIKQDIANNPSTKLKPYFVNCLLLIGFVVLMIPLAFITYKYIYCFENHLEHFWVLLKLLPCYVFFVFDSVVEAYFFATGKLHHIFIQNLITNILVYLTAFILYLCNVWVVTLDSLILLFNLGVIISSVYTLFAYMFERKKNKNKT